MLEKLFPRTRGGGRRDESREVPRVGAGDHLLLQQLMQILVLQNHLSQNRQLQNYGDQKLEEASCTFSIFSM